MQQSLTGESQVPTLAEVWTAYRRSRKLKPVTVRCYDFRLKAYLADWLDRPITSIKRIEVENRHYELTQRIGPRSANATCRILSAMINYASVRYEDHDGESIIKKNPVKILSETRAWNKEYPRQRYLNASEIGIWWGGVSTLSNKTIRDYLAFLLFTGCRAREASELTWDCVDLERGLVVFIDTKNRKDHVLPVCQFLRRMLMERHAENMQRRHYVFPTLRHGYPYKFCGSTKFTILRRCGLERSPHDMRRSYATLAKALRVDIVSIKRLLNHAILDTTERYIIYDPEVHRTDVEMIGQALEVLISQNLSPALPRAIPLLGQEFHE